MNKFNPLHKTKPFKKLLPNDIDGSMFYALVVSVTPGDVIEYQPISLQEKRLRETLPQAYPLVKNQLKSPLPKELVLIVTIYPDVSFYVCMDKNNNVQSNTETFRFQDVHDQDEETQSLIDSYINSSAGLPNAPSTEMLNIQDFVENNNIKDVGSNLGDVKIQGRFGNAIVFSYHLEDDTSDPEPIVIITNEHDNSKDDEEFIDPLDPDVKSHIVLTPESYTVEPSTELNDEVKSKEIPDTLQETISKLDGHQIYVRSGRILFDAYNEDIIGLSKKHIYFNSNEFFGVSTKDISLYANNNTTIKSNESTDLKQKNLTSTSKENTKITSDKDTELVQSNYTSTSSQNTKFTARYVEVQSNRIKLNTKNLLFRNLDWLRFMDGFLGDLTKAQAWGMLNSSAAKRKAELKAKTGI